MRFTLAQVTFGIATLIGASPCVAQTRITSLDELRHTLSAGDFITVVAADGRQIAGHLIHLSESDLDIQVADKHTPPDRATRRIALPLNAIQSLERRRDSVRNGAAIGSAIGAGFGGAMFAYAFVIDRNEADEWAPLYVRAAAVYIGIGALIGWAIDAANSRPHITFEPSSQRKSKVSVQPVYLGSRGIALAVRIVH